MPAPARAKNPQIEKLSLEEQIRHRAHELYVERGNQSGSEFDDWLQAEEEIHSAEEALDEGLLLHHLSLTVPSGTRRRTHALSCQNRAQASSGETSG